MPSQLAPADRRLLWVTGAIALVLMSFTVAFAPAERPVESNVPSSYSSQSGGALAAYLLLQDLHYDVRRWQESPVELASVGRGSLLLLVEPDEMPSNRERQAIREFVERGGRVLFCGGAVQEFFPEADVSLQRWDADWKEYSASLPSHYTRDARTVAIRPKALWKSLAPLQAKLYGDSTGAAVVSWPIGRGEALWWAAATPLTNVGIRRAANLAFVLDAIGPASTIYWDEYFHGQRASLWSYVERTPVAWALAQLALLLFAVLFTFSRRWGPVVRLPAPSRLSPLEFVDTLGGLYQRAGATSVAVRVAYRHLRMRLCLQLGMPASATDEQVALAASARLGWDAGGLGGTLEAASSPAHLPPRRALTLIQSLESYAAQLGARGAPRTEIN